MNAMTVIRRRDSELTDKIRDELSSKYDAHMNAERNLNMSADYNKELLATG